MRVWLYGIVCGIIALLYEFAEQPDVMVAVWTLGFIMSMLEVIKNPTNK